MQLQIKVAQTFKLYIYSVHIQLYVVFRSGTYMYIVSYILNMNEPFITLLVIIHVYYYNNLVNTITRLPTICVVMEYQDHSFRFTTYMYMYMFRHTQIHVHVHTCILLHTCTFVHYIYIHVFCHIHVHYM